MESSNLSIKYKNRVINVLILVVATFIAYKVYVGQQQTMKLLTQQKEDETKKNAELLSIGKSEKRFEAYKKYINQKDLASVMDTISNLAITSGVRIASMRPGEEKIGAVVSEYMVHYTVLAKSYHSLGNFIGHLESHPFILKVNKLDIKPSQDGDSSDLITVNLEITTVLMK